MSRVTNCIEEIVILEEINFTNVQNLHKTSNTIIILRFMLISWQTIGNPDKKKTSRFRGESGLCNKKLLQNMGQKLKLIMLFLPLLYRNKIEKNQLLYLRLPFSCLKQLYWS